MRFSLGLHDKDKAILEKLKESLGAGQIYRHGPQSVAFQVQSLKDLENIIKHFDNFPLMTEKFADYEF